MLSLSYIMAAAATAAATPNSQLNGILASTQSFLSSFVLLLGPIVFLAGLVMHGIGSMHNSQKGTQWGGQAMKTGAFIFVGALAVTIVFSTIQGVIG